MLSQLGGVPTNYSALGDEAIHCAVVSTEPPFLASFSIVRGSVRTWHGRGVHVDLVRLAAFQAEHTMLVAQSMGATNGNITVAWDTTRVTNMHALLAVMPNSNESNVWRGIGDWQTGAVTTMSMLFRNNAIFNQVIGKWATGRVTTMLGMFQSAVVSS